MLIKGDRAGRGHSIYDNVSGEMMIVNDEDPAKIEQGFETCAVLIKCSKGNGWFVYDVDEGFKSSDKILQSLVDEYNEKKNQLELQELVEQAQYEQSFRA